MSPVVGVFVLGGISLKNGTVAMVTINLFVLGHEALHEVYGGHCASFLT